MQLVVQTRNILFLPAIFSFLFFGDSFDWFIMHLLLKDDNYVEGYQLFLKGGCATENSKYPRWEEKSRQLGPDQEGPCHQYCVETQGCKYFEFEHKTGWCRLHNQEITKSNGYPGVKCFKMVSGNNQCTECNIVTIFKLYYHMHL